MSHPVHQGDRSVTKISIATGLPCWKWIMCLKGRLLSCQEGFLDCERVLFYSSSSMMTHLPREVTSPRKCLMNNLDLVGPCSRQCKVSR